MEERQLKKFLQAALGHRLPSLRAGSICARLGCIYDGAHRIAFGRRSRETRPAHRSGKTAPRTVIFGAGRGGGRDPGSGDGRTARPGTLTIYLHRVSY